MCLRVYVCVCVREEKESRGIEKGVGDRAKKHGYSRQHSCAAMKGGAGLSLCMRVYVCMCVCVCVYARNKRARIQEGVWTDALG